MRDKRAPKDVCGEAIFSGARRERNVQQTGIPTQRTRDSSVLECNLESAAKPRQQNARWLGSGLCNRNVPFH